MASSTLVARVSLAGQNMDVKDLRADSSVRGFGALAPHPGRHRLISCEMAKGCWEKLPRPSLCLPERSQRVS